MGEIAEMMLSGLMCEGCGVFMDDMDEPGYPRRCCGCSPSKNRACTMAKIAQVVTQRTPEQMAKRADKRRRYRQRKRERAATRAEGGGA